MRKNMNMNTAMSTIMKVEIVKALNRKESNKLRRRQNCSKRHVSNSSQTDLL
jgi:hypothetical protein